MGAATDLERLAKAVRAPGRLCLGPTAVSGSYPFGGVNLGFHRDGEIVWNARYQPIHEPTSGAVSEVARRSVEFPEVYCLIEGPQWDEDVVAGTFSSVTRSGALAHASPAENRINGTLIASGVEAWPPMAFVPNDTNQDAIYIPRPYPTLSLKQAVRLSMLFGAGLPMKFTPSSHAAWQTQGFYQVCRWENVIL